MRLLNNIKQRYRIDVLKGLNWHDVVDKFQNEIIITLCVMFLYLYLNQYLTSIRKLTSDAITFSSVILAIIGVLVGMLMGLESNSPFFKNIKEFEGNPSLKKLQNVYEELMKRMKNAFLVNILFISITIFMDILIPIQNIWIKGISLIVWIFLFIKINWQVYFLIHLIVKIAIYKPKYEKPKPKQ